MRRLFALALAVFVIDAWFLQWDETSNARTRLALTRAIVEEGRLAIDSYHEGDLGQGPLRGALLLRQGAPDLPGGGPRPRRSPSRRSLGVSGGSLPDPGAHHLAGHQPLSPPLRGAPASGWAVGADGPGNLYRGLARDAAPSLRDGLLWPQPDLRPRGGRPRGPPATVSRSPAGALGDLGLSGDRDRDRLRGCRARRAPLRSGRDAGRRRATVRTRADGLPHRPVRGSVHPPGPLRGSSPRSTT